MNELRATKERLETQLDKQARVLRESEENFHNVVRKSPTGILLVDTTGIILFTNPTAECLLGRDDQDLLGSEFGIPAVGGKTEVTIHRPNGQQGTAELTVTETQWRQRKAYLLMLHDITERKEAESQARYLAQHDSLTRLPNRMLFADRLNQALLHARRTTAKVAVLFLDLDRFKEVNDTLGHEIGNQLLQKVASLLTDTVRQSDTVARVGGDEFTVLLEGLSDRKQVSILARKLRSLFERPILTDAGELFSIPSIGISLYPDDADDGETLIRMADNAMYYAKRHKELDICFYFNDLDLRNLNRLALENSLRRALDRGEFVLHYQIQIDLRNRQMVGMEALVRWQHPDRGVGFAQRFHPVTGRNRSDPASRRLDSGGSLPADAGMVSNRARPRAAGGQHFSQATSGQKLHPDDPGLACAQRLVARLAQIGTDRECGDAGSVSRPANIVRRA